MTNRKTTSKLMRLHQTEIMTMLSVTLSDADITLAKIVQHVQLDFGILLPQ